MPERIDTKAVLDGMNATIRGNGKPSSETLLVWWKALAQEVTDHEADRNRLETLESGLRYIGAWAEQNQAGLTTRQVADAVQRMCDDALAAKEGTLKIEPMSELETAYMDLKGKLAAAESRIEALVQALPAKDAEGLAGVCMSFAGEMLHKQDDIGQRFWTEQAKRLRGYAALAEEVKP